MKRQDKLDLMALARGSRQLTGELCLSQCPRVRQLVVAAERCLHYTLEGGRDERGRPLVKVALNGSLRVVCQRCLKPFEFVLKHSAQLLIAADREELALWDEEPTEVWLNDRPVDLHEWLEDEILLSLPYAPRHADADCPAIAHDDRTRNRMFEVLRDLERN